MRPDKTEEAAVYSAICSSNGIKAKDIALKMGLDRRTVNKWLYSSPFLKELCWQDRNYLWHGQIAQSFPHSGLREYCGYYSAVKEFRALEEDEWLSMLKEGCADIGRSLNDTRGLIHSFRDERLTMLNLFEDLDELSGLDTGDWEIVFELRIKKSRYIRIYADVLVITADKAFSLEFKMKDEINPSEISQAAKYVEPLEVILGPKYDVIPALILTGAEELFTFIPLEGSEGEVPVSSGDMLFNVFDEYIGFLKR